MPTIVLDGTGKPKSDLVEGAYEFCGLNGFEFERTPEEMTSGLRHLNDMMAEWEGDGVFLGFDFPTYGNGLLEEPSGVPNHAVAAIKTQLALRLAAGLGGTLSGDAKAALNKSFLGLKSRMAAQPPTIVPTTFMPSSGVRHGSGRRFTTVPVSDDPGDLAEIVEG